jgi:nucleoid-associated protein YgaU
MTLNLSLSPDVETRLKAAATRNGQPADQYAVQPLDQHLPPAEPAQTAARMLLRWAEEAEALTDAESAENEQILRAIDADRLSDRKLFSHHFRVKNR